MRTSSLLTAITLIAVGAAAGAIAQERVKPKGPADFKTVHASVKTHFDAGSFGKAYAASRELTTLIGQRRAEVIRKSLPVAPPEYTKVPYKEPKNKAAQNAMLGALAASVGNIIDQKYTGPGGQITVTVTADSPLIGMFKMMINNPAMIGENQELIKYGDILAILETSGKRKTLKILIGNSMVDAAFPNHSDDFIFGMWNQAAVDAASAAIIN